jgi:hypothetical protein
MKSIIGGYNLNLKKRIAATLSLSLIFSLLISGGSIAIATASTVSISKTYIASKDYSSVQGHNQWYYQKVSGTFYSDLIYNKTSERWEKEAGYPWIANGAQHPDSNFDSVRKWVSPGDGTITITGTVKKGNTSGDGVVATIKKDNKTLWTDTVKSLIGTPKGVQDIPVVQGTAIYFIVNKRSTMTSDHTLWDPTIVYKTEEPDANPVETITNPIVDSITGPVMEPIASSSPAPAQPSEPISIVDAPPNQTSISVVTCGARPNDNQDDYAAIVACVDKAKTEGKTVYVPEGTFLLSRILTLDGVSLEGAGNKLTTLTSTDPKKGSIDIRGNGVTLSHIKHTYQTVVPRGNGANEKNSITVRGATNFVINEVHVQKASTAGILVQGVSSIGKITNNFVESTNADGIHITDGSHHITIENNQVKRVGDDTIAVVSYKQDGPAAHHITIKNNDVGYDSKARGISVVGGTDIVIDGNSVNNTNMAGIYISVEGSYNTSDVNRVTVNNNTVIHTGIQAPQNHPNVLVYASQGTIDNVSFTNNLIKDGAHRGIGVWGDGNIENVTFTTNTLINTIGAATTFTNGIIHLDNNLGF